MIECFINAQFNNVLQLEHCEITPVFTSAGQPLATVTKKQGLDLDRSDRPRIT